MVGRPALEESRGWGCGEPPLEVRAMPVPKELAKWRKKLPVTETGPGAERRLWLLGWGRCRGSCLLHTQVPISQVSALRLVAHTVASAAVSAVPDPLLSPLLPTQRVEMEERRRAFSIPGPIPASN